MSLINGHPGFTDFFMSPITGRIILPMFPDLFEDYIWTGDRNDRPIQSPVIIDLRLEIIDLRRRLSQTRFILQAASPNFDSSQALNELVPGILRHTDGIVAIATPWVDYVPVDLPYQNIWIGDENDVPQPNPRIFVNNLPHMLSGDPTLLFGAYNLYSGSPNPLTLGEPQIIKTLHITNMADLNVGQIWRGQNSVDPLNFGPNRPVPSDDLTNLENTVQDIEIDIDNINNELTEINNEITEINNEITEINNEIDGINVDIDNIFDTLEGLDVDLSGILEAISNIEVRLDGIDVTLGDLQLQIDTNVASGLDHLADLQLQIDTNVASGLDHLADLQLQIDAGIESGMDHLATINGQIDALDIRITALELEVTAIQADIVTINASITDIQTAITTINSIISTIQTAITNIEASITNITEVLLPDVYNYIDDSITNITNNFIAGGNVDLDGHRIINLQCDPEEDNDAVSFCFLWHILHDEVNILWP